MEWNYQNHGITTGHVAYKHACSWFYSKKVHCDTFCKRILTFFKQGSFSSKTVLAWVMNVSLKILFPRKCSIVSIGVFKWVNKNSAIFCEMLRSEEKLCNFLWNA